MGRVPTSQLQAGGGAPPPEEEEEEGEKEKETGIWGEEEEKGERGEGGMGDDGGRRWKESACSASTGPRVEAPSPHPFCFSGGEEG